MNKYATALAFLILRIDEVWLVLKKYVFYKYLLNFVFLRVAKLFYSILKGFLCPV